jgi:hypothetical protein
MDEPNYTKVGGGKQIGNTLIRQTIHRWEVRKELIRWRVQVQGGEKKQRREAY